MCLCLCSEFLISAMHIMSTTCIPCSFIDSHKNTQVTPTKSWNIHQYHPSTWKVLYFLFTHLSLSLPLCFCFFVIFPLCFKQEWDDLTKPIIFQTNSCSKFFLSISLSFKKGTQNLLHAFCLKIVHHFFISSTDY